MVYIGTFRIDNGARMQQDIFCSAECRTSYEQEFLSWDNTFAIVHTYSNTYERDYQQTDDCCLYCAKELQ